MAGNRTVAKWARCYVNGYDMSGYTRSIGPLLENYDEMEDRTYGNQLIGSLPGHVTLGVGTLSAAFDNTATSGPHVNFNGADPGVRDVMVLIGMRAEPTKGDVAYCVTLEQSSYVSALGTGGETVAADMAFQPSVRQTSLLYPKPWGKLIHPKGAETAANSADTADIDNGSSSNAGGYMMYQVFAGDGNATIKVQDSATELNGSYSDLLSSGALDCSAPKSGIIALSRTAAVERYIRWQVELDTATTVTFALAFVRGQ